MAGILNLISNYFGTKDISQYPELLESNPTMTGSLFAGAPLYPYRLTEINRQFRKLKLKSI
jgi:hypothetical protein